MMISRSALATNERALIATCANGGGLWICYQFRLSLSAPTDLHHTVNRTSITYEMRGLLAGKATMLCHEKLTSPNTSVVHMLIFVDLSYAAESTWKIQTSSTGSGTY